MSIRPVKRIIESTPTIEGAGVRLRRAFGFGETAEFDPFLLFDDFRNDRPEDYLAGFPWHPHRGIETITYVLAGSVEHGDSLGNRGSMGAGDVQWMTAGSGILHQEMPRGDANGRMHGFQLWANLPASLKMTHPRYQDVAARDVPEVVDDDGTKVRVVCGDFWGKRGPVEGVAADPRYLDVWVPPGQRKTLPVEMGRHGFAYVFDGAGAFRDASTPRSVATDLIDSPPEESESSTAAGRATGGGAPRAGIDSPPEESESSSATGRATGGGAPRAGIDSPPEESESSSATGRASGGGAPRAGKKDGATGNRSLVLFDRGDEITVQAGDEGVRFLLVSGKPIEEPVAWYGPIVMNTEDEIRRAYAELRNGTFIKKT